jgi:hypothetical protein
LNQKANPTTAGAGSREGEKQGKAPQTSKESSAPSGGGGEEGGKGDGGEGAIPEALAQALAADNYYESLGISASEKAALNDAKVRRAYLKTSVKVRVICRKIVKHEIRGGGSRVEGVEFLS